MSERAQASPTTTPDAERDRLGSIALDQWRGLALVFVLISHGLYFTHRTDGLGRVGVNLFFFISGILVFRSLSRTRARTAGERTKSFWWRRLRRLYPAMISYTVVMLPLAWLLQNQPGVPPGSDIGSYMRAAPWAMVYGLNYVQCPIGVGHMWSLACEMQFYLIAPIIYLLGGATARRRTVVFGTLLILLMASGLAQPFIGKWKYHFEFAVWPMMLGFVCEFRRDWFQRIPERLISPIFWLAIIACAGCTALAAAGLGLKPLVVAAGAFLLAPCLMAYIFGRPMPGIFGAAMGWIGQRTYSIYLWQQPLTICNFLPSMLHPVGAVIAIGIGGVWFHFFEKPFLSGGRSAGQKPEPVSGLPLIRWVLAGAVVLLIAGYATFWIVRNPYEARLKQQVWPTAVTPINAVSKPSNDAAPTVLLLGDSRMAEWDLPPLPRWHVVNAGAGGFTTAQVLLGAPAILDQYHPAVVVLQAGINDLKFAGLQPAEKDSIVSLAASNTVAIVTECEKRHCKVLVLETWPANKPDLARRLVWSGEIYYAVIQFNERLRKLDAPERGIRVLDLFKAAGIAPEPALFRDTLHFKPAVYERLTPILEHELDALASVAK